MKNTVRIKMISSKTWTELTTDDGTPFTNLSLAIAFIRGSKLGWGVQLEHETCNGIAEWDNF